MLNWHRFQREANNFYRVLGKNTNCHAKIRIDMIYMDEVSPAIIMINQLLMITCFFWQKAFEIIQNRTSRVEAAEFTKY